MPNALFQSIKHSYNNCESVTVDVFLPFQKMPGLIYPYQRDKDISKGSFRMKALSTMSVCLSLFKYAMSLSV